MEPHYTTLNLNEVALFNVKGCCKAGVVRARHSNKQPDHPHDFCPLQGTRQGSRLRGMPRPYRVKRLCNNRVQCRAAVALSLDCCEFVHGACRHSKTERHTRPVNAKSPSRACCELKPRASKRSARQSSKDLPRSWAARQPPLITPHSTPSLSSPNLPPPAIRPPQKPPNTNSNNPEIPESAPQTLNFSPAMQKQRTSVV